ncbi:FMNH2-dependent monooxygenase [Athelia psychrophila]|uniref:FMNH2-dependent monooxygenase n=1 Tax=Athelia psychrophila TaxID=1759441 RepID=A0A166E4M8_9AGAM|nr:FMNH2-dependent monooxygenase [Fibularhizoctonia sp. CBS 109695]
MAAPASSFEAVKAPESNVQYPSYDGKPALQTEAEFLQRAREVAELLAVDVADRDLHNVIPYDQVALLKASGLVTALGPTKYGGGGQPFHVGLKIQREVSAGDGSIGQLLGYHYLWSYTAQIVGTPAQIDAEAKRYTEGALFHGGAVNPRDADLAITEADGGATLVFNGRKAFSTGSKVSDLTVLEGVLAGTETHVFAIADSHQAGIQYGDDWNNVLGMRGTQSGSITLTDVRVPWSAALGFTPAKAFTPLGAYNTTLLPAIQLVFANIYLGVAQGALAKAAAYTARATRPWPHTGAAHAHTQAKATDEFYIQDVYGALQARVWGLEAQLDAVGELLRAVLDRPVGERGGVTGAERGLLAVRVAAGKVQAIDVALDVTSRIYEVMGARSIAHKAGFDHFWRNVRTHSLHDPVAHKRAEVGRFVLSGELPPPTWYT